MIHQEQLFQQSSIFLSVIVPHKHVKATQKQLITHLNQNKNKNKKTYQYVRDNFVTKFHARTQLDKKMLLFLWLLNLIINTD